MKGKKNGCKTSKRSRIIKYSIFTAALTCVIVVGFYLVSNGIIFGKYVAKEPYIKQEYIDNSALVSVNAETKANWKVTPKNSYTEVKKTGLFSEDGTRTYEYLAYQDLERATGATTFTGKRTIYFDLENKLDVGDLMTSVSIGANEDGKELTLYSVAFTKEAKDDSESRLVSIFSSNESIVTKDKDECRTDVSWNTDGSVAYTTEATNKDGGMRFYIDGSNKESVDLSGYRYLKVEVSTEAEILAKVYKGLPEVPETDGTDDLAKGTAQNPFIILEIVPEMSQSALGLLTGDQKQGMPFDPLEFSYEASLKKDKVTFRDAGASNGKTVKLTEQNGYGFNDVKMDNIANTNIPEYGGWFDNNNAGTMYEIYNPSGTVHGAEKKTTNETDRTLAPLFYIDTYYTVEIKKDVSFANQISNGQSKKPIAEIQAAYPDLFVDKDGKTIAKRYFTNDKMWIWTHEKDPEDNKEYTVKFQDNTDAVLTDYEKMAKGEMTFTQFAQAHRTLFAKTTDDKEVLDKEIERSENWTYEKASEIAGYFVYVGKGKGDFAMGQWEAPNKKTQSWEDLSANAWKYYENLSDIPADITYHEFWPEGVAGYDSAVSAGFNNLQVGYGFPASRKGVDSIQNSEQKLASNTTYTFKYKYEGYIFRFELVGVKLNEILKRQLFYYEEEVDDDGDVLVSADEKYANTHMKVITLTPAMINAMDAGDTDETLSIVERADMFYIVTIDSSTNACSTQIDMYNNFSEPSRNKTTYVSDTQNDSSGSFQYGSYHSNDLEWNDCMKIIKRLSGDTSLPMMFDAGVGRLLDKGVTQDSTADVHMYVDDKWTCKQKVGSLNNIAKLYLVATQFDLSAKKANNGIGNEIEFESTFMDDIYDEIYQVPLTEDEKRHPDSAKYTGYYNRKYKCSCYNAGDAASVKTAERCNYLWNLFTFMPNVPTEPIEDSLYNGDHTGIQANNFLKYGFLSSSLTTSWANNYISGYWNTSTNMGRISGTIAPLEDNQNVTVVHQLIRDDDGKIIGVNVDNENFSLFNNAVMIPQSFILYQIISNREGTPVMSFSVLNKEETRKYYQKISDESVLIDYSQTAEYKSDKTLYLYCNLDNSNNKETSILKSITLYNPDDESMPKITLYPYDLEDNPMTKEMVDFDIEQKLYDKVEGYAVPELSDINFKLPFKLSDWQKGYTMVRLDWVARTSRGINAYQNPSDPNDAEIVEKSRQYAEVNIGERGLFVLQ